MSAEILIVDDNADIRNILNELISDAGYKTRVAANYNQALHEIDKKIPGYICKFNDGKYIAWNLNKVKEPKWYVKPLPKNSKFGDNTLVDKDVGDLMKCDGVELI